MTDKPMSAEERASYIRRWLWARFVNLIPDDIPQRVVTLHDAPDDVPADYRVLEAIRAAEVEAYRRAARAVCEGCERGLSLSDERMAEWYHSEVPDPDEDDEEFCDASPIWFCFPEAIPTAGPAQE